MIFETAQTDADFFQILPSDWREEIEDVWEDYKNHATVYVVKEANKIIGGGIELSKSPPHFVNHYPHADKRFSKGWYYLGYIWVAPEHRNRKLGSFFLNALKAQHPQRKYWLLIEDKNLENFYTKNAFCLEETVRHDDTTEWLMSYNPQPE